MLLQVPIMLAVCSMLSHIPKFYAGIIAAGLVREDVLHFKAATLTTVRLGLRGLY